VTAEQDAAFTALAQRIAGRAGLDVGAYKDRCLRRRIAVRMRACGVHTYADYLGELDKRPDELDRLLDTITINVTKFYRNPETWSWLERNLLTALVSARRGRVRVWSAGCASGEEPYTIAMVLAQACAAAGREDWIDDVRIDATDIDRESLDRARAARYNERVFSETPPLLVQRYCRQLGPEEFEVDSRLRSVVAIRRLDLLREPPIVPQYDLIFCRNVVIYFDRRTQERLMGIFFDALIPGGHLVLGKVETIFGPIRDRLVLVEPRERVYRKPV
jgi:chemotaxis methyl-accepting protein methylase